MGEIKNTQIVKRNVEESVETLVRIMGFDIFGSKNIFSGLTKIKGVSWSISNAICIKLNIPKNKKIGELTKPEIERIENFMKELPILDFLKNRRFDPETGETKHNLGTNLDIRKDFDIKRLIKIKSYKGSRHASGLPVRGQRTRAHFRSKANKKVVGSKKIVK